MDPAYDMTFGRGGSDFIIDSPEAVAQSVLTRLNLWTGEWWLDLAEGTPWMQQILGKPRGPGSPDAAIRSRILGTLYVTNLYDYGSAYDPASRSWAVGCVLDTWFGTTPFAAQLIPPASPAAVPVPGMRSPIPSLPPGLRALPPR